MEPVHECWCCGHFYPVRFDEDCPFCYVQEFLEAEAEDGYCPICGTPSKSPTNAEVIAEIEGLLKG